jgi:hypothetical protein
MTSDTTITVRIPVEMKSALVAFADVKDITLSKYVVSVLGDHLTDKGLSPSAGPADRRRHERSRKGNPAFVNGQVVDDLVNEYRRSIDSGLPVSAARVNVRTLQVVYSGRGIVLTAQDEANLEAKINAS